MSPRIVDHARSVARIDLGRGRLDPFAVSRVLAGRVERALPGTFLDIQVESDRLLLPRPHEVWRHGRTLRAEEHALFDKALRAAITTSRSHVRAVYFRVEALVTLAWDDFRAEHWAALGTAYAALPDWVGGADLPRWLSRDETEAHLWASVEPPGLQLAGLTERRWWAQWRRALLEAIRPLPSRTW